MGPYWHLLSLMVVLTLVIFAYCMSLSESCFAPIGFFFVELIFCGLLELGEQLADPWGSDDTDFPLCQWTVDMLEEAFFLVENQRTGWEEERAATMSGMYSLRHSAHEAAAEARNSR